MCFLRPARLYSFGEDWSQPLQEQGPFPQGSDLLSNRGICGREGRIRQGYAWVDTLVQGSRGSQQKPGGWGEMEKTRPGPLGPTQFWSVCFLQISTCCYASILFLLPTHWLQSLKVWWHWERISCHLKNGFPKTLVCVHLLCQLELIWGLGIQVDNMSSLIANKEHIPSIVIHSSVNIWCFYQLEFFGNVCIWTVASRSSFLFQLLLGHIRYNNVFCWKSPWEEKLLWAICLCLPRVSLGVKIVVSSWASRSSREPIWAARREIRGAQSLVADTGLQKTNCGTVKREGCVLWERIQAQLI